MSALSSTAICNMALARIGHQRPLADLQTDTGKAADNARLFYENTRDAMLREHYWNFSIKRAALTASATSPNHEYDYAYPLPTDYLRMVRTSWEATGWAANDEAVSIFVDHEASIPYRIENHLGAKALLCNEASVSIEYVAQITDTSIYDPLFTDCLAQRLAAEFAGPIADNANLTRTMWDIYQQKLASARTTDAMEGSPRDVVDTTPWIRARV